ncbi:MAG: hypothetical protein RL033_1461 [Pseudomonadota bacterium]
MTAPAGLSADALPFVSVVLPVLNGEGRLEHSLEALNRQDYPRDRFEVIVADGRSRDRTVEIASAFGCRVVDNPGISVAAGRNAGIRHARGALIAFSEDDIVLPPHWLSSAVRLLQESGAAGVGGPTPIPPSSSLWSHAVNAVFRAASARGASVQSDRAATGVVDDLPGGNSIYSAQALREVGPIDESLPTAEDVAMHHDLRQRGLELRLSDELSAAHHKRDSVSGFFRQIQRFAIGRVQLFRRWRGALSPLHWLVAIAGPLALGVVLWGWVSGVLDGPLLALLVVGAGLGSLLMGLLQRERPAVAALFPVALLVFLAGWSVGFWSEWLLPSRSATRTGFVQNVRDIVTDAPLEGSRPLRWLLSVCLAIECCCLAVFSQRAPFIMDELQQGGYARHIDAGYYSKVIPFKTVLFTYVYYLPRLWLDRASAILLVQRAETAVLVLATLLVLFAISRRVGRTRLESAVVVATTLSFSTFFEHGGSLRAEPSALLLATLALYAAVSTRPGAPRPGNILCGMALGGAFFCTQKSIWFCVSIGLATLGRSWLECRNAEAPSRPRAGRELLQAALWLGCGFLLVAIAYCFAFPPATPAQVFQGAFLRASRYAVATDDVYGNLRVFIWQSLERNWWLYSLCAAGLAFAATRIAHDAKLLCCWLTALAMGTFILTWKEPWPYVLTWLIPFLALFAPDACRVMSQSLLRPRSARWQAAAGAIGLLALVGLSVPRRVEALAWDNRDQLALVGHVESLLGPRDTYQDGIGMISTRDLAGRVWWDARAVSRISAAAQHGDTAELALAFLDQPKVLILNYRLQNLAPALEPFLARAYVPVDRGLMIAGVALDDNEVFQTRWAGRYALVDATGARSDRSFWVDGVESRGAASLGLGLHQVRSECRGCYLLPEDVIGKVIPTPARTTVPPLFDQPYTR